MGKLSLFLLISILCFARDNPFHAIDNIDNFTQTNKKDTYFEDVNFKFPNSARVLKDIEITYQNLDGSISKKIVKIDKKIDWHNELILSKKINIKKEIKPIVTKSDNIKKEEIKKYSFQDFIKFEVTKKSIKIITKDKKIRDFLVSNPYKIVVDFKRNAHFLTKSFKVDLAPFVSIVLGNHDNYYRVVIELDGQYVYSLKNDKGDFIITLK